MRSGQLVALSERCLVGLDGGPHYQVRVAPRTDAGLVLCRRSTYICILRNPCLFTFLIIMHYEFIFELMLINVYIGYTCARVIPLVASSDFG